MKSISTNVKLIAILVFIGAIFALVMLWSLHLQNQMLERSLAQERRANSELVDKVVCLSSTALLSFANDYSLWDDMVQFVSTRDQQWSKINIDPELAIFNVDVVWICDTTASPIYGVDIWGDNLASAFPLSAADRDSIIGNARFHHLFARTQWGLLEIQQAAIQPSTDSLRQSPAKGYFVVGKIWSPPYLKHFSELIGSQLSIEYPNERVDLLASQNIHDATIRISSPLQDLRGQATAYLTSEKELTEWQSFRHVLRTQLGLIVAILVVVFLTLAVVFYFWISRPLIAISRGLQYENPELLGSLLQQKSEFGKFARLIRESIDQRRCFVEEIIERQQAEAALRESQDRLGAITGSAKDGIIMLDAGGNVCFWNPAAEELTGYSADEIMGHNFYEVIVPARNLDEHLSAFAHWQRMGLGNTIGKTLELQAVRKDGIEVPVELSLTSSVISNEQYTIGIVHDIAERRCAEEALLESEERYRTIMESVKLGVSLIDVNHKIIMANSFFADLFKKPAADFVGRYCFMEFEKRAAICPHCPGVLTMASGKPAEVETEGILDDGSCFNVLVRTVPTFASDGTVSGFVEVIEDITKRKRAEGTLRESEERLRDVIFSAANWVWEVDQNGAYTYSSQKGFDLLGRSPEEIIGKTPFDFMQPDEARRITPIFSEIMASKAPIRNLENWNIRKDGGRICLLTNGVPILDKDGNLKGYRGVDQDITERKLAEENKEKMLLRQQGISQLRQLLLAPAPLEDKLRLVTDSIVRLFDADFCRIWLIRPGDLCEQGCIHSEVKDGPHICRHRDRCLHLLTSSGRYTHIDGQGHRRVPFGCYKIGLVASGEENKFVTNDAPNDPRVHNHAWVRELGLVSFAGYQLRVPGGETLGVLALFAKHPISADEDSILEGLGSTVALIIKQSIAEESLHRSETKFRTLYDSTSDAVMLADERGFLDCNKAALTIFGCATREEFCSKHPADVSPPQQPDGSDSLTLANQQIAAAMEKGSNRFEWIHKRLDTGGFFYADVLLNAIELDGKPVVQAVVRDVTERKQAENEIRRINAAINATGDAVGMATADGRHFYQNEAFGRLFGYTLEEVSRLQPAMLYGNEDDAKKVFETIMAGKSWNGEIVMVAKNGRRFPVSLRADAVKDDSGNVIGLVGVHTDVTEQKLAAEAVREQLRFLHVIIDAIPTPVYFKDADGRYQGCNEAFADSLGLTRDDLIGKTVYDTTSPELAELHAVADRELIESGGTQVHESKVQYHDGTQHDVVSYKATYDDAEGRVAGLVGTMLDITERKRVEEALRASEIEHRMLFENAGVGIAYYDLEGRVLMLNALAAAQIGGKPEDFVGRAMDEILPPEVAAAFHLSVDRLTSANPSTDSEEMIPSSTGPRWYFAKHTGIFEPNGVPIGVQIITTDITERKRAEEERTRFIAVIDEAPESIAILNADGSIMYVNHAFERIGGVASSQAIGRYYEALARKLFANNDYHIPWDRIQAGESWTATTPYQGSDGGFLLMDQSISPIRSRSGEIINYVLFNRDVTEERELEIRARWADERLRLSIDGMVDGLTLWDVRMDRGGSIQEFVCSEANPAALMMLGKERQDAVGCSVRELLKGAEDHDPHELFLRVHERGRPLIIEHLHFLEDDRRLVLTIHVWAIGTGVACHLRDVTQQLELETQLRQAQKLEAVGSLAAGIAHEINTPIQFVGDNIRFLADSFSGLMNVLEHHRVCREKMAALIGEQDELQQLRDLDKEVDVDYLKTEIPLAVEQSLEGVSRVSTIVRAMKDFSHIDEREMVLADINQMLDTTLTVARNELKYVADVTKDFASDLPTVECFRNDLNQVFLNLFINAAHAIGDVVSAAGQGRGTITVATRFDGDEVVVSISDTGAGIPESIRDRIFDHFFTTKEVGKGTGQGLSIARSIVVEKHKGAITFESEIGKGTTFHIHLPITRKEVEHVESQHPVRG